MKDYYKILGVDKNASKDDIKKAFRKLAHEHHPDKTKNDPASAQKFKEASEAYSVLSDDNKRKQYDMFGSTGSPFNGSAGSGGAGFNGQSGFSGFNQGGFGGFDFSGFQQGGQGFEFDLGDIFGDFFGGNSNRRSSRSRGQEKGTDISVDVSITFEESIFGVEKDLFITKNSKCISCNGSGAEKGSTMNKCKTCEGRGRINETKRTFLGAFNTSRVCEVCNGQGQVPSSKCITCNGTGVHERSEEITIKIPAGIENGQSLRLSGAGEAIPFGVSGDLYVKVHVKSHSYIFKEGNNLISELPVKLSLALIGGDISFKTLDGDIVIKIPEGTNNGDVLRIKGKGVPYGNGKRGDLFIKIKVIMPKRLSKEARRVVEELKKEGM